MIQKEFRAQLSDTEGIILQYEADNELHSLDSLNKRGYSLIILDLSNELAIFNYSSSDVKLGKDGL